MIIKKAEYFNSMKKPQDYPGGAMFEIAFAGKSNVGKSSLINLITNHSKLAHVSKQPGKTRLIHFFNVNDRFYLVDLPGYGYAKVSKEEKTGWNEMMEGYFAASKKIVLLMILVDIRHAPTQGDVQMVQWACHYNLPFLVVGTKADKIAKSKRHHALMKLAKIISEQAGLQESFDIVAVSSMQKTGRDDVLNYIEEKLQAVEDKEV